MQKKIVYNKTAATVPSFYKFKFKVGADIKY